MVKEAISTYLAPVQDLPLVKKALALVNFEFPNSAPVKSGACCYGGVGSEPLTVAVFSNGQEKDFLRAFGKAVFMLMDETKKTRVKRFLTTVDPDWVATIKLNWPDLHNFKTYDSLVQHHTTPVSRLCTVILCRTFSANGVSRENSVGTPIQDVGSVHDFLAGTRYYSIISLVGAYGPHLVDDFPQVFVEGCADFAARDEKGIPSVSHTEVQKSLKGFFRSVLS